MLEEIGIGENGVAGIIASNPSAKTLVGINKTVEIALEKGIIKSKSIIVDATHTAARYSQKSPREVLQERSKKLRNK